MRRIGVMVLMVTALFIGTTFADTHGHKKSVDGTTNKTSHSMHGIVINEAWARASTPGAKNGVAYLSIENHGSTTNALVSVTTPVAGRAELHTHKNESGVMKMEQIHSISVAPHKTAVLRPGGDHIMLLDLEKPLKIGSHFMMMLKFKSGSEKSINVMVVKNNVKKRRKHDQ